MHILTIDDEEFVRLIIEQALREEGCEVESVGSGPQGLDRLRSASFDCVITDLRMPGLDGRAVLRWVKEHQPDVDVIVLTGHGEVKDAVAAIKDGAWDFLVKDTPFDGATVKAALAKLRTIRALRRENLAARHGGYKQDAIVEGVSQAWQFLNAQIAQVAPSRAPVLIQGETGSGKEVVARLLHTRSRRAEGPCIAVNCGAVSRELLESELFGYEKGAFTGAATAKPGLIAAAEDGSLFLDEIGEMPGPMQVSLLRFLDRNEYRPVGSTRTLRADVRIICATNRDVQELVLQGRFRDDLLYRINTVTLRVPPLRERQDDLPALVDHILSSLRMPGAATRSLTPEGTAVSDDLPLARQCPRTSQRHRTHRAHEYEHRSDYTRRSVSGTPPIIRDPSFHRSDAVIARRDRTPPHRTCAESQRRQQNQSGADPRDRLQDAADQVEDIQPFQLMPGLFHSIVLRRTPLA